MTINYYPGRKIFGSCGICFDSMIEELDRSGRAPHVQGKPGCRIRLRRNGK